MITGKTCKGGFGFVLNRDYQAEVEEFEAIREKECRNLKRTADHYIFSDGRVMVAGFASSYLYMKHGPAYLSEEFTNEDLHVVIFDRPTNDVIISSHIPEWGEIVHEVCRKFGGGSREHPTADGGMVYKGGFRLEKVPDKFNYAAEKIFEEIDKCLG
ncbi:MAG: hypothetical protein ABIG93_01340 [archaeon]|nr:hypothetical protein [Nanoarchaeota archaeon]